MGRSDGAELASLNFVIACAGKFFADLHSASTTAGAVGVDALADIFWLACSVRSISGGAMGRGWLVIRLVGDFSW